MHGIYIKLRFAVPAAVVLAVVALVTGLVLSGTVWANGADGAGDNDFNIRVEAATGPDPASKPSGSGTVNDPVKVRLVDPLSTESQQWNVIVTSTKNQVGRISIKFVDTNPNMKIKGRDLPTSGNVGGTLPNNRYYPDLFTQMRFSVFNGSTRLWTGELGTDGNIDLSDERANNPAKPGYLQVKLPVSMRKGETRTLVIKEYIDTTIAKDDMNVYNGTTTGLMLLVKGETR
ncbi:hypothetical protein GA0061078_0847 [Bifidobacterium bohemicum]|uniref:Putative fimbrial subunit FimB n=1 Tax=Bifidobacterium bohemicum DSM 22767 TaxID=1437606 RepID=A0A086ZEZ0_9BIFI|nr:hypothetical protein [Bifidobacterium bohemicum]KFI45090.1 putative fimbrial subunit FimB [Bifidobacterium bohemicum DSM 22767]SCB91861.1 hypothetical protein GA0061078_0847 [Bifidobacterium bohemicum]